MKTQTGKEDASGQSASNVGLAANKERVLERYPDADWISVKDSKPENQIAVVAKNKKKWNAVGEGATEAEAWADAAKKLAANVEVRGAHEKR